MNKTFGFLLGIAAFFTVVFYMLLKRNLRLEFLKDNHLLWYSKAKIPYHCENPSKSLPKAIFLWYSKVKISYHCGNRSKLLPKAIFLKRSFLTAVAVFITFFSHGKILAAAEKTASPEKLHEETNAEKNPDDIESTDEWKNLKRIWLDLKKVKAGISEDIESRTEREKKTHSRYLDALIGKGYIPKNLAYILNYVYGELLYHRLRSTAPITCYKMTVLGGNMGAVRGDLEKRLSVLSGIFKKGAINEAVLEEVKSNITREIEFMNRAEKLFEKGKITQYDDTYWREERALAGLFKDGKVDVSLKAGDDVNKAAELIMRLNADQAFKVNEGRPKLEKLGQFKEWGQIKSNWQDVHKLEVAGYDSLNKIIEEKKKDNLVFLSKLVSAGLITQSGAKVFNNIYGNRIFHHLRPKVATCYEPTVLGMREQSIREDLEARLNHLAEISKEGKVSQEVIKQAETNLSKDMEVILLIEELWGKERGPDWEKYRKSEEEILAYFIDRSNPEIDSPGLTISDDIKIRQGVREAAEIARYLYKD